MIKNSNNVRATNSRINTNTKPSFGGTKWVWLKKKVQHKHIYCLLGICLAGNERYLSLSTRTKRKIGAADAAPICMWLFSIPFATCYRCADDSLPNTYTKHQHAVFSPLTTPKCLLVMILVFLCCCCCYFLFHTWQIKLTKYVCMCASEWCDDENAQKIITTKHIIQ